MTAETIALEVLKYLAVAIVGAALHAVSMTKKLTALTDKLESLADTVKELVLRGKAIDRLVDKTIEQEDRLAALEAKVGYLEKYVEKVEQEITK